MLTLLLFGMLTLAFNIQPVRASGTIYIRVDGSIDPPTAPIQRDGDLYTFTDNIYDSIVIERNNMTLDGAGYTVYGPGHFKKSEGLTLSGRSNVTIKNSQIKEFGYGIYIKGSSNISVYGNNVTENWWYDWVFEDYFGYGILVQGSSNNSVSANNITDNYYGIELRFSNYNSISGNTVTASWEDGVSLVLSSNNRISENNIKVNGGAGIDLFESSSDTLSGNNIANNNWGIYFAWASNEVLRSNSMVDNDYGIYVEIGGDLLDYLQDADASNTIDGKPVYWWVNKQDMVVPPDAGFVALVNCTRITIRDLNIAKNGQAILLAFTSNSEITRNNIANNYDGIMLESSLGNSISRNNIVANFGDGILLFRSSSNTISENILAMHWGDGIYLESSSGNKISGNNITANDRYGVGLTFSSRNTISRNNIVNNMYGIYFYSSSNNMIFHNNFTYNQFQAYSIGSSENVLDDGYPSGGNYWSDYVGVDRFSGPYRNKPGEDGIGDRPYILDVNNIDRHPLMQPYTPQRILVYTDNETYHAGDTMQLGLHVTNLESAVQVDVQIWLTLPDGSNRTVLYIRNQTLPAGTDYNNPSFKKFILPSLTLGIYIWHATLLEPTTHKLIVEDTEEWLFD